MTPRPLRPSGKLSQDDARRHHRSLLLQHLFHSGPMSRADLARATALTRVTVSDLIGEMVAQGLVEELGARSETRVGKPATLVGIAPDSSHVISLDLSRDDRMSGAVINLAGGVRARRSVPVNGSQGDAAVALVGRLAKSLMAATDRPVLGVGVASPGIVGADGVVLDAPNLDWHGTPLAAELSDRLRVPVHVANDANTAALGEFTFGDAEDGGLMVLRVGKGLGAGIIIDGHLIKGQRFAAGEVGHVVVDPTGEPCACGRNGCLETLLAAPHLRARLTDATPEVVEKVFDTAGSALGAAISPVVAALNLRELVLSGPEELLTDTLTSATAEAISRYTMPVVHEGLSVRTSRLGQDVVLAGAAVLVLSAELGIS